MEEKRSLLDTIKEFRKLIIIIFIGMIITFFLGYKASSNFNTQEKTTHLGLENVGLLVTQTCYTTVLEDSKVNLDFFKLFDIPFTQSRQIFSYDFEVDAAMDFDKIKIKKINDNTKEIEIELPHSGIYKTTLNPDSFRVYLDTTGILTRIDLEHHNEAIKNMQDQAKIDCMSNKILNSADENAERLIDGIIKSNKKYKDYKLSYIYK